MRLMRPQPLAQPELHDLLLLRGRFQQLLRRIIAQATLQYAQHFRRLLAAGAYDKDPSKALFVLAVTLSHAQ